MLPQKPKEFKMTKVRNLTDSQRDMHFTKNNEVVTITIPAGKRITDNNIEPAEIEVETGALKEAMKNHVIAAWFNSKQLEIAVEQSGGTSKAAADKA
jgi:hypothetical protein